MRIDPNQGVGVPALRLVKPAVAAPAVQPVRPAAPVRGGDTISFEAVYVQQLPREPRTEAHQKVERIRQQLVAGKTDVPIHFNAAPPLPGLPGARSNNPYRPSFLKLSTNAAEFNASATQAAAE